MRDSRETRDAAARLPAMISSVEALRELAASRNEAGEALEEYPKSIAAWLGRLVLLYGIPFHYLVPYPEMLPPESIRFFRVDPAWLDSLAKGALSIGSSTSADRAQDIVYWDALRSGAARAAATVRGAKTGKGVRGTAASDSAMPAMGFLLRSAVVSGWPGLEVQAFADEEGKLERPPLRIEHLAPDLLLCLYSELIASVHIHEQPEGLHFGVDVQDEAETSYAKSLKFLARYSYEGREKEIGEQIPEGLARPISLDAYFRPGDKRVLTIGALEAAMKAALGAAPIGYDREFTPAQFALEMIEGVEQVAFSFKSQYGKGARDVES
jgi:hypothetical protein